MKKPQTPHLQPGVKPSWKTKKGIALITVLAMMSLMTILILTFFSLAQNEYVASTSYSRGIHAQQLAETAVNLVVGQLRAGTTTPESQKTRLWASQPGAIRAYLNDGPFDRGYKLYSDDEMVVDGRERDLADFDLAEMIGWEDRDWEFVDLNEPVIRGENVYYPIVDPLARDEPKWEKRIEDDDAGVEGFSYDLTDVGEGPMYNAVVDADPDRDTLPMPVKWIYVLEDGSMGTMDSSQKFQPFDGSNYPADDNQLTGRVAFWADDETSKININTAAGGAAWDTPRAGGEIDRNLGRFQPAQREWQRYPAHPATTYLSSVLYPGIANITLESRAMEKIFEIVPRVVGGGSLSGTRKVARNSDESNGLKPDQDRLYASLDELIYRPGVTAQRKIGDSVSIETREVNEFPSIGNQGGDIEDTQEVLERSKFFLTVTSRAPEVNLFNRPRVSMWPTYYAQTNADEKYLTPFDELIRFCAEMGQNAGTSGVWNSRHQYHFQRMNSDSTTDDWTQIQRNQQLWAYLDRMMALPIPGYGESFADKYGLDNQRQILTQIFDYIRCTNLFDDTVYDYASPGNDDSWQDAFERNNKSDHLTFTNYRNDSERGLHMGHGQVAPIIPTTGNAIGTKGFGRFYTIDEVGIQLICCADGTGGNGGPNIEGEYSNFPPLETSVDLGNPTTYPAWLKALPPTQQTYGAQEENWNWQLLWKNKLGDAQQSHNYSRGAVTNSAAHVLDPNEKMVQAVMLFKVFSPSSGWTAIDPDFAMTVDTSGIAFGSDSVQFQGSAKSDQSYDFQTNGANIAWVGSFHNMSSVWGGRHYGGSGDFRPLMRGSRGRIKGDPEPRMGAYNNGKHKDYHEGWAAGRRAPHDMGYENADQSEQYDFVTVPFVTDSSSVQFSGGNVTIQIMSNRGGNPGSRMDWAAAKDRLISAPSSAPEVVQTFNLDFTQFGPTLPAPELAGGTQERVNEFNAIYAGETTPHGAWSASYDGANPLSASQGRLARVNRVPGSTGEYIRAQDTVWSLSTDHGDQRIIAAKLEVNDFSPASGSGRMRHTFTTAVGRRFPGATGNLLTDADYNGGKQPLPIKGAISTYQRYGDFDTGQGGTIDGAFINKPDEGNTHSLYKRTVEQQPGSWEFRRDYGEFPYFVREWTQEPPGPAYFSPNRIMPGPGMLGSMPTAAADPSRAYNGNGTQLGGWQTLAFRPDVAGGDFESHPGSVMDPPDHLIMDLFWMPVVEPYAISEPLSTAGKINMNYQILPFTYVRRATGMYAIFKSEYMQCIPNIWANSYKTGVGRGKGYHWKYSPYGGSLQNVSLRSIIIEKDTLEQFDKRFADGEIFKSATEICDIHLVPDDISPRMGFAAGTRTYRPSVNEMANGKYWTDHKLVGDNGREMPYTHIQPRLTTKSNTFKVHYRAQVITKGKGTDADQWDEIKDVAVSEFRGSTIVERYVEPEDPNIPDYAVDDAGLAQDLDNFYKYRVINPTRFAP